MLGKGVGLLGAKKTNWIEMLKMKKSLREKVNIFTVFSELSVSFQYL